MNLKRKRKLEEVKHKQNERKSDSQGQMSILALQQDNKQINQNSYFLKKQREKNAQKNTTQGLKIPIIAIDLYRLTSILKICIW